MPITARPAADRRVVLNGVSWSHYQTLRAEIGDAHVRLTFDRGRLEIMSPSLPHERVKTVLARLIEAYADATNISIEGFGSTTFDREDLQKGLEPDECYFVASASAVAGKADFDWAIDPPPDLAIEIDISPPGVNGQLIYAARGVAEIWKFDGAELTVWLRSEAATGGAERHYTRAEHSVAFPRWPVSQINYLLQIGLTTGQSAAVRALREFCIS